MSRKNLMPPKLISSGVSLGAAFQTEAIDTATADNIGFWVSTSSVTDNTGEFKAQIRAFDPKTNKGSDWVDLTLDEDVILADADLKQFINLNQVPHGQVRLSFIPAGATPDGTVDIWVAGTGA